MAWSVFPASAQASPSQANIFPEARGEAVALARRSIALSACLLDRKSTRLNSSHSQISYAVFCLKKKNNTNIIRHIPPYHRVNETQSLPHYESSYAIFLGSNLKPDHLVDRIGGEVDHNHHHSSSA